MISPLHYPHCASSNVRVVTFEFDNRPALVVYEREDAGH